MNAEEIRKRAIECVEEMKGECTVIKCEGENCAKFEDCTYITDILCHDAFPIWAYEHGFADGVEEGKKQSVKHGHWIGVVAKHTNNDLVFLKCSNCFDVDVLYVSRMKYCPNCGAKMDEKGEQND